MNLYALKCRGHALAALIRSSSLLPFEFSCIRQHWFDMTRMFSMSLPTDSFFCGQSCSRPCGVAEGTSDARVSDLKESLGAERQSTESGLSAECQKNGKGCTVPALEWQPAKLW